MSSINKVIVAGAGGNLGPHILSALREAGFIVSALTRPGSISKSSLPSYVTSIPTDYTSSSLMTAFVGQDAIVSCMGVEGVPLQTAMIDAAEQAGVRRFIPSEFGWARDREILPELAARLKSKDEVFNYLVEKCNTSRTLTWSAVATGPFLDWSISVVPSLGFDVSKRTARIVDSGEEPVTCSTGAAIGKAAAGMLLHEEHTRNRFLKVRSARFTQNQCLTALEKVTGSTWDVLRISTAELIESKGEKLQEKRFTEAFLDVLAIQLFEEGAGRGLIVPKENDNELLGVIEEDILDIIKNMIPSK